MILITWQMAFSARVLAPISDRYSLAWKFSARLGLVLGYALKVWASRLLLLGQYPRMRVQQDDGLMCLLVVATLPKAVVPWHLGPASTPSVRKLSAERMELETYCAWLPASFRVPMCLLRGPNKGADVTVSRPVPSPGPGFQLTSEQFIRDAGWCEGSGVVSTRTGGALSLFAMNWLQQSSKALWKTLLQLTGTFFFLVHPTRLAKPEQACSFSCKVFILGNMATFALDCSLPLQ